MNLDDIFGQKEPVDLKQSICHSGGAEGADTYFDTIGQKYGVMTKAYSYKTPKHKANNKVEISDEDYQEGITEVNKANHVLGRYGIHKYMNLLARNWAQVKYSEETFAIGSIVEPHKKGSKGYYNKSKEQQVDGGTGYCSRMSIIHERPLFVFDQNKDSWFEWSYITRKFKKCDLPTINYLNFAGVGTRDIKPNGIQAIGDLYENTLNTFNNHTYVY